jgi:hypothetical protein
MRALDSLFWEDPVVFDPFKSKCLYIAGQLVQSRAPEFVPVSFSMFSEYTATNCTQCTAQLAFISVQRIVHWLVSIGLYNADVRCASHAQL